MTKVICSNCGAEMELPEESKIVLAKTVSQEGNGVIYLKMKHTKKEDRLVTLQAHGFDIEKYFSAEVGGRLIADEDDDILNEIKGSGYVKNTKLHRRWVMAQMFKALEYENGFNAWLRNHGYNYQWKMLLEEVRIIARLMREDSEAFDKRARFFKPHKIADILLDYYHTVKQENLRRIIEETRLNILGSGNDYSKIYNCLYAFYHNFYIKLPDDTPMSKTFIDCYKGSGAYFTCENLIKWHGCVVHTVNGILNQKGSLEILEGESIIHAAEDENYKTFAFMKKLIADNNFDFKARMEEIYN